MVRTLAQQLTNEQQNAAGIGQHVDPVKRFVMINVLCVDREDEAEESRQHLEPRVDADEGINELFMLERRHRVAAKHRDDRRCGQLDGLNEDVQRPQRRVGSVHPNAEPFRYHACDHQYGDRVNHLLFVMLHQIIAAHEHVHDNHNKDRKEDGSRVEIKHGANLPF